MLNDPYFLIRHDGKNFSFGDQGITIGRHRSNDIAISDTAVSRSHARILVAAGKFWIRDKNSASGTYVNERRIHGQQEIKPGDILRVGKMNFRLVVFQAQPSTVSNIKSQKALLIGAGLVMAIIAMMFLGSPGEGRPSGDGVIPLSPIIASPTLPDLGDQDTEIPHLESASKLIFADTGGQVTLEGVSLEIPPGALNEDTEITIRKQADAPNVGDRGVGFVQLEPSGTSFSTPANMALDYVEPVTFFEEMISFYTFNESEFEWEELRITNHDMENNRVNVEVEHFSTIVTIFNRPIDLVLDIPGDYLLKGDLIYALTPKHNGFSWFPGHAALLLGTRNPLSPQTDSDGKTIIESTPLEALSIAQAFSCRYPGIRYSTLEEFKNPSHIYMGARRLPGLSGEDRSGIAQYAISAYERDANYGAVAQGNIGENCYSCVGLTEAAYDDSDNSIIPGILEFPYILPIEQYIQTQPVNEITVQAGDLLTIGARRVIRNPDTKIFSDDYQVNISGCPDGAVCENGRFRWQTDENDIGANLTLYFSAQVTHSHASTYYAEETLLIHIVGTGTGNIDGQVLDGTTGLALSGVEMVLSEITDTTITDSSGYYSFEGVSSGHYTITAQKENYAKVSNSITVSDDETTSLNFSLPLISNPSDIVITLSWGEYPDDLDSHLWLPEQTPYHIYFQNGGNLDVIPFTQLDVDDTNSFGPENITIRQQFDGRYVYAVHNYSGSPPITTSSATVTVVKDGRLTQTFEVPMVGDGLWWYVFDYDAETGNIIPRNVIMAQNPGE